MPALDRDAADVITGSEHILKAYADKHSLTATVKKIAHCTNNKEVFLTILRHHVREGHLQYFKLNQLRADLYAEDNDDIDDSLKPQDRVAAESAENDSLPCELGLRYPLLQSILAGRRNHQTLQVRLYRIRYSIQY